MTQVDSPKKDFLQSAYRTHTCGELRNSNADNSVTLSGWVMRKRDHGGVVFVDLRDHYGVTQVVFHGALGVEMENVRPESVIMVQGVVHLRGAGLENPKLQTGQIEVHATKLSILSHSELLPFQVAEDDNAPEPQRLKYRFLELRREKLHAHIAMRNRVVKTIREVMDELGFAEFHTPILTSSSPEGARDFIVPSRLHPGKFYALPQAPQQFKQLLMIAGFDRYFQIAPCFRDEDARADRSPGEFYQIDMELSFVEQEDVLRINERMMYEVFKRCSDWKIGEPPFPRFSFAEAMNQFGTDKPDLRNALRIMDVSEVFGASEFRVFREALSSGGTIRAIAVPVESLPSRKYFDDTIEYFSKLDREEPALGLGYIAIEGDAVKGSISKFVSPDQLQALRDLIAKRVSSADAAHRGPMVVFFAAGQSSRILPALGKLRNKLGADLTQLAKEEWRFCWVTDFPFYVRDEDTGGVAFNHNPFSLPQGGMESLLNTPPLEILAHQYDFVLHGYELASGGLRNYQPELMFKAFELTGYSKEMVEEKFGGMIRAFTFGAPPHGGIAHGVERIVMLLCGEEAIREVIAFPLAQNGEDLLMGAPSGASEKQLREAHIQLRPSAKV